MGSIDGHDAIASFTFFKRLHKSIQGFSTVIYSRWAIAMLIAKAIRKNIAHTSGRVPNR
jgi:hypothetical protein